MTARCSASVRRRIRHYTLSLLTTLGPLAGCSTAARVPANDTPTSNATTSRGALSRLERSEATQRLYTMGERYYDVGNYAQAVALWRQVFLLLPPGPEGDGLRHQLVARMAHGMMRAYEVGDDPAQLDAAEGMLERYVEKHGALFPKGAKAKAERAEIYELIGAIAILRSRTEEEGELDELELAAEDAVEHEFDRLQRELDTHAGEGVDADGIAREVVVPKKRRRSLASLDDPKVQAYLRSPSPLGSSMLAGGDEPFNPARPLVRAGLSRVRDADVERADQQRARRQLRDALRVARPKLEQCYAEALTRSPRMVERLSVSVTIDGAGRVAEAEVLHGRLADPVGDACVAWAFMEAAPLNAVAMAEPITLELPVTFFVQPERRLTPSFLGGGAGPGDAVMGFEADLLTAFDRGVGP